MSKSVIHIYAAPHTHARTSGKTAHGDALGHALGAVSHVAADFAKGDGRIDQPRFFVPG